MDPARIAALLTPYIAHPLFEEQVAQFSAYLDLLLRWNARVNLTAIRDEESIVTRHFGESLFAASHLFPSSSISSEGFPAPKTALDAASQRPVVVDIGSGAGFPGIPFRIWAPHIHLTLIESNHKKVAFLREVCRGLRLTDVNVFAGRAQDFSSAGDLVTLRAVERFQEVLPVATSVVRPGGRLALLIGSGQTEAVAGLSSFSWRQTLPTPNSRERVLVIGTRQEP